MPKSDAEVANINARSRISTARTKVAIIHALDGELQLGEVERGTLNSAVDRAYALGWQHGVKDATE